MGWERERRLIKVELTSHPICLENDNCLSVASKKSLFHIFYVFLSSPTHISLPSERDGMEIIKIRVKNFLSTSLSCSLLC